jgi:hypothetical protein
MQLSSTVMKPTPVTPRAAADNLLTRLAESGARR